MPTGLLAKPATVIVARSQGTQITDKTLLTVLWTSDNPVTTEKMVLMYTVNALAHGWCKP
jgi:hypothetical protein